MSNIKKPCNVCKSSYFAVVDAIVRDLPTMAIFKCLKCGLVFLENFDHIDNKFYEKSKMRSKDIQSDIQSWECYLSMCDKDDSRRLVYLKNILPNKKLLDFGCGAGGFLLKAMSLTALPIAGVELDKSLREKLLSQKIRDLSIVSKLEDLGNDKYDIITMFHVLEHLADPQKILTQLKQKLNKNGQLVIEVPNSGDALLSLYNSKSFSNFTYWKCHLYIYNENNLRKMLEDLGFKVNYINQVQRYPLSNHLFWLTNNKPGGHEAWDFLDTPALTKAYETSLAQANRCDTLFASVSI